MIILTSFSGVTLAWWVCGCGTSRLGLHIPTRSVPGTYEPRSKAAQLHHQVTEWGGEPTCVEAQFPGPGTPYTLLAGPLARVTPCQPRLWVAPYPQLLTW